MRVLFLLLLVFCVSCNSDTTKPLKIHFEEKNFPIEQVGVSSSKPFFFFTDSSGMYVFDEFTRTIIKFGRGEVVPEEIISFVEEDRFEVSEMQGFIYSKVGFFFFNPNQIIQLDNEGEVKRFRLEDLTIDSTSEFLDYGYKIQFNLTFGKTISAFDAENNRLFFVLRKDKELKVGEYSLNSPSKVKVYDIIDNDLIDVQRIGNQFSSKISLSNAVSPILSYANGNLIISYPFQNSFQVFDLKTNRLFESTITSSIHPNSKEIQYVEKDELNEFVTKIKAWNNDITFGPIYWEEEKQVYYRLVKGVSKSLNPFDGELFLSLFDSSFSLIQEQQLMEYGSNLSFEYFKADKEIWIKKVSTAEDELAYQTIILSK
ncbi:MAG: DUF4221 family protein [Bacteroidota bacterium]